MNPDISIMIPTLVLTGMLVPQAYDVVVRGHSINIYTSTLTAIALGYLATTHLKIGIVYGGLAGLACAAVWLLIAIFSYRNKMVVSNDNKTYADC